jgi:hypothetical protein
VDEHSITLGEYIAMLAIFQGPFLGGGAVVQFLLLRIAGVRRSVAVVVAGVSFVVALWLGALVLPDALPPPRYMIGPGALILPGFLSAAFFTLGVAAYAWKRTRSA